MSDFNGNPTSGGGGVTGVESSPTGDVIVTTQLITNETLISNNIIEANSDINVTTVEKCVKFQESEVDKYTICLKNTGELSITNQNSDSITFNQSGETCFPKGAKLYSNIFNNAWLEVGIFQGSGNVVVSSVIPYTNMIAHSKTVGSYTLPANSLVEGSRIKLRSNGWQYNANYNMNFSLNFQGVRLFDSFYNPDIAVTTIGQGTEIVADISVHQKTGNNFSVFWSFHFAYENGSSNSNTYEGLIDTAQAPTTLTFDSTLTSDVFWEFRWDNNPTNKDFACAMTEISLSTFL